MYRSWSAQSLKGEFLPLPITQIHNDYMLHDGSSQDQGSQGSQIHQQNVSISVLLRASSRQIINFPRQIYEPYT